MSAATGETKQWLAIVCTRGDGLYKVKINGETEESAVKNRAHNLVMEKFKPAGISTVIVQELTPELEEKIRQSMATQAFMEFMNGAVTL